MANDRTRTAKENAQAYLKRYHDEPSINENALKYAEVVQMFASLAILEALTSDPDSIPEYGTATADAPTEAVPYGPDTFNLNFRITTPENITAAEAFKIAKGMLPYGYEIKTLEHRFQEHGTKSNNYVYLAIVAVRLNPVPYGAVDA